MGFLLGSFTGGLFSGASDVMDVATKWERLKQERQVNDELRKGVADLDTQRQALQTDQGAKNAAAAAGAAPATPATPKTPVTYTDKDLAALPVPKYLQSQPAATGSSDLEGKGSSGRQGRQSALTPSASSDLEGKGTISRSGGSSGALDTGAEPGTMPSDTSGSYLSNIGGALNRAGQAIRDYSSSRMQQAAPTQAPAQPVQTQAPTYLPGSPQNPATAPIPPRQAPQAAIGGMPTLANNMTGMGPRILAALNPTAGSAA